MNTQGRISNVTRMYLERFHCILEEMIQGMTTAELNCSISHNFIVQMIPHHRAAIEMSENILKYTIDIPLQNIAERIISEQTKSITDMQRILGTCEERINSPEDLEKYQCRMDEIMQIMFCDMESARSTNQIDADFMREMIPHHRGAVEMSELTLRNRICPQLRPVLQAIITSQKRGIVQIETLLSRMGNCGCS